MLGMEVLRLREGALHNNSKYLTTVTTSPKVPTHRHTYDTQVLNLHASSLPDQPVTYPSSGTNRDLCPSVGGPWAGMDAMDHGQRQDGRDWDQRAV